MRGLVGVCLGALLSSTSLLNCESRFVSVVSQKPYRFTFSGPSATGVNYRIHRVWKAHPKGSANGNQVHDLEVNFSARPSASDTHAGQLRCDLRITQFSGIDLDGAETKHLREVSSEVKSTHLVRNFTSSGSVGRWEFFGWNNAGWAGMMAEKAVGLYEIGFLDLLYPAEAVDIGERWSRNITSGNEGVAVNGTNVKGNVVPCNYVLRNVDVKRSTATIEFSVISHITFNFREISTGKIQEESIVEKQSGKWTVSLKTGMPLKFHADRSAVESSGKYHITEQTVTDASAESLKKSA